jgi:hypothetical protein
MLLTSPACPTCLVKSGLPPRGQFYKVVCSVCGGTGAVTERSYSRSNKQSQLNQLLIASPLLLLAGFMTALGLESWRSSEEEIEQHQAMAREMIESVNKNTPIDEVKMQVVGRSLDQVRLRLGEPESTQHIPSPEGPTVEVWFYNRRDGRLKIRFENGTVKEVSSS